MHFNRNIASRLSRFAALFFAALLMLVLSCSRGREESRPSPHTSIADATHIDSLYNGVVCAQGGDVVARANALFAALDKEEITDSLIQYAAADDRAAVLANASYWMGEYLYAASRPEEAIECAKDALEAANEFNDTELEASIYSLLSASHQRIGHLEQALEYALKCSELSERSGDRQAQSSDYNNLAAIALQLKRHDLAKRYIDKAIAIEKPLGRDDVLAVRYGIASEVYLAKGDLATAEDFARKAYDLDTKGGREGKAAVRLAQLAQVQIAKGEDSSAIETLSRAIPGLRESGNKYSLAVAENRLGALYHKRGDDAAATAHFEDALQLAQEISNLYQIEAALSGLAASLKSTDIARAYDCLERSAEVKDSISVANDKMRIAEVEQKYEQAELRHEMERQQYSHRIQQYVWIGILIVLFLTIGALAFVIRAKKRSQAMQRKLDDIRTGFFTNITHEFRTPVSVIMGLSENIATTDMTREELTKTADVITRQGQGLLELVNQILDISKVKSEIGKPEWREGNIISYMHMIAESYRQTANRRDIELVFSPNENNITIPFIPDYLYKTLNNLISNSLKFTSAGGHIYISTSLVDGKLRIRVADDGRGIDREDLPHVFEPFYQGSSSPLQQGTGIGLALASQMVRAMGGSISVKSAPGKGAVFTILLPLRSDIIAKPLDEKGLVAANADSVIADIDERSDSRRDDDRPIALVVEDNDSVLYYIRSLLGADYRVCFARNGAEGLEKAAALVPDIIITDLMMPEMDGFALSEKVRANDLISHVPIIVITAKADKDDKLRALQAGVDVYLTKPFNREELLVRAAKLIEHRRMLAEKYQRLSYGDMMKSDDMPTADRKFISSLVDTVYSMLAAGMPTDIDSVAANMKISRTALTRRVRSITGDTTLLYINKIKIAKAKSMMDSDSTLSIADVSYACGFEDPNYFSRIFKQVVGITPSSHQRRVK